VQHSAISPTASPALPGAVAVAPLLLLLRVNLVQNWRRLCSVREQSSLLTVIIGLFIGGYIVLAFGLFYKGLKFIGVFPGIGELLIERLLFLLFAFLFILLLFSNLVIGYSNFFRNRETAALLTLPIPAQTVFRWKFVESTVLASWAFLFLIAPLLGAYGMWRQVPWHFYALTVVLVGLFIMLPAVFGTWTAVNLARFLDRRAFQIAALVAAGVLFFAVKYYLRRSKWTRNRSRPACSPCWIVFWLRRALPSFPSCQAIGSLRVCSNGRKEPSRQRAFSCWCF